MSWLASNLFRHLVASAGGVALRLHGATRDNVARVIDHFAGDTHAYGYAVSAGVVESCEDEVVAQLERAIGVIYRPQTERQSHYFQARLTEQFDALIHIDRTTALVPLEPSAHWYREEVPETYPSGL
jgi:hypothetical protein